MDSRAVLLSGCDEGPCFPINNVWVATVFLVLIAPTTIFLAPFVAFRTLQEAGRIKFSMEPVVGTGLGLAAGPTVVQRDAARQEHLQPPQDVHQRTSRDGGVLLRHHHRYGERRAILHRARR